MPCRAMRTVSATLKGTKMNTDDRNYYRQLNSNELVERALNSDNELARVLAERLLMAMTQPKSMKDAVQ